VKERQKRIRVPVVVGLAFWVLALGSLVLVLARYSPHRTLAVHLPGADLVPPTITPESVPTPSPTLTLIPPTPTATRAATPHPATATPGGGVIVPTRTPTRIPSEGALDFEPPLEVYHWSKIGDTVRVVLRVAITGGTPPFTISHGPTVHGQTKGREYFLDFEWSSCKSPMAQSITVESADGQRVKKDYYIPVDRQPWCATPSPTPEPSPVTETPVVPPTGTPTIESPTDTPLPPPSLTPTPVPARLIEAEWPERMEVDQADYVRVSLVRTEDGTCVPTVEKEGHTVAVATPEPVGTPGAPVEGRFGPAYKVSAAARLEGTTFKIMPLETRYQSLDQDQITWVWNICPLEPGPQIINAHVVIQWKPAEGEGDPIECTIWRAPLEIAVKKPWMKTAPLTVFGQASGALGLMFNAYWLYQWMRDREKRRGTAHVLSFDRLSPDDFERLCLWLVREEGYVRAEHLGLAGSEQGRDVIAYKAVSDSEELWYFQCKRYSSIGAKTLKDEVNKYLQLAREKPRLRPDGVVFVVSCAVSAKVREEVGEYCEQHGLRYEFWALTELDLRVKQHPDLLKEFFNLST
jgi:hypothetical protein